MWGSGMEHYGDITKISGYTAPIVDCVIGGSPCQDLSVAGKRAGLDGERSGLYTEQVRIVKEMRAEDEARGRTGVDIRPRYMVWENVPGAFSSNKGEDFRIVLEELAKVKDKDAVIPMPESGKWANTGSIVGDGWSIAWRVLDAQFWGTSNKPLPQRRRRIALIADFGGQSAPEILFVRKSVSGDIEPGKQKGEGTSTDAERSFGANDCIGFDGYNGVLTWKTQATLGVNCDRATGRNGVIQPLGFHLLQDPISMVDKSPCMGQGASVSGQASIGVVCYGIQGNMIGRADKNGPQGDGKGALVSKDKSATPACNNDQYLFQPVYQDKVGSLCARDYKGVGSQYVEEDKLVVAVDCRNATEDIINGTLQSNSAHSLNGNNVVRIRYLVRRLTPLECERLQGYPDGWTDIGDWTDSNGKKRQTSDAARYKALGNSIALPPWKWVLKRLCACYERDATMASLFDGIGGFPYLWEQLNGKGTCLWASEIEEFPIAVTKVRINNEVAL